jgi:peptide subunit release factor 1 (eRF1)
VSGYVAGLPRTVANRVAATFTVDPATATPDDVLRLAAPLAQRHDEDTQRQRVAEVLDVYDTGGLAVVGLGACLRAGSVGAVGTLVVEADAAAAGVVCEACGWLGLRGRVCAACECPVRGSEDVLDDLVESVIDQGGSVHRIRVETPLRGWTCIAALRYRLPAGEPDRAELVTTGQVG